MKKLRVLMFAIVASFAFMAVTSASGQIVPKTKHYSKKVYHKGGYYTVTTWRHGKRITKKVWYKSNRWGHKIGHKTKTIVMGEDKPKP